MLVGALMEQAAVPSPGHVVHGEHDGGFSVCAAGAARIFGGARTGSRPGQRHRHLDRGQCGPGVALARRHDGVDRLLLGVGPLQIEPSPNQGAQVVRRQRVQAPQRGPAQQGRVHLEERILRGGPDEDHQPVLDGGEQHVLLGLGEAVHLVDEEHGALAVLAQAPLGLCHRLADVLHARRRGREGGEMLGRGIGQQVGDGRLPGTRGTPQDRRADPVRLGQHP